MPGPNPNEIRVAGTGRVLVAALGTTVPVGTDTPWASGWTDLGRTSTEGIAFIKRDSRDRVDTWRSVSAARYVHSGRDLALRFVLMQPNEDAPPLVFGDRVPDERMLAVEFADGETVKYRFVIPRGHIAATDTASDAATDTDTDTEPEPEEPAPTRTAEAGLGVTFTALAEDDDAPLATLLMTDLVYATA